MLEPIESNKRLNAQYKHLFRVYPNKMNISKPFVDFLFKPFVINLDRETSTLVITHGTGDLTIGQFKRTVYANFRMIEPGKYPARFEGDKIIVAVKLKV